MEDKKKRNSKELCHRLETRVTSAKFKELSELLQRSENRNMSELLRDILYHRTITVITHDDTALSIIKSISSIRHELNKIGVNINQITHYFNGSKEAERKLFYAMEVAGRYEKVNAVMESVLVEIDKLGALWLQK